MKYGRLTLVKFVGRNQNRRKIWLCRCDCGSEKEYILSNVKNGNTKSCGCISKESPNRTTHGMEHTRVYSIWLGIKKRCSPGNNDSVKYYSRGIRVCERWMKFENFYADMGEPPTELHSIERIDNDGDYELENCRWATAKEQANNRISNKWIEFNGERLTLQQWADKLGLTHGAILYRMKMNYPMEVVLSPVKLKTGMKTGNTKSLGQSFSQQ